MTTGIPPIERTIAVTWDPHTAYTRFVDNFGAWWPTHMLSVGGARTVRVVFEARPQGLIYEEFDDGRRFQWGRVIALDPPRRVVFSWHPSRPESTAQQVEVRFEADGSGTRVKLISSGWENWGPKAAGARRGYNVGWNYVLNIWAQRGGFSVWLLQTIGAWMQFVQRFRGGQAAAIAKAEGEIVRS